MQYLSIYFQIKRKEKKHSESKSTPLIYFGHRSWSCSRWRKTEISLFFLEVYNLVFIMVYNCMYFFFVRKKVKVHNRVFITVRNHDVCFWLLGYAKTSDTCLTRRWYQCLNWTNKCRGNMFTYEKAMKAILKKK